MVKATSTIYALLITLLMGILCSGLILYVSLASSSIDELSNKQTVIAASHNGFTLLQYAQINERVLTNISELSDQHLKVLGKLRPWGIYNLAACSASQNDFSYSTAAILGSESWSDLNLYVRENFQALVLAGNAYLEGKIALSTPGLKRSGDPQLSYTSEKLPNENLSVSKDTLPKLFIELREKLQKQLDGRFFEGDSIINYTDLGNDTVIRSFLKPTLVVFCKDSLVLNGYFKGNIVFYSKESVTLSKLTSMEDVLVFADRILMEQNCKLNAQLIGRQIEIKGELTYPSSVVALSENAPAGILLDSTARLTGSILVFKSLVGESYLNLNQGSVIKGNVFADAKTDFQGEIHGQLICDRLVYNYKGSSRDNFLFNGQVKNWPKLHLFTGAVTNYSRATKLVKWLQ